MSKQSHRRRHSARFLRRHGRNIANVSELVREAADQGAQVVLPPELFEGPYFRRVEDEPVRDRHAHGEHPSVLAMQKLAGRAQDRIPTSFFELTARTTTTAGNDGPDGKIAGVYRKSHIPDGPGYEEKFYFRPGNTGFKVWKRDGTHDLGVGICWDQWYPEMARAMMLMGAEILFYPTAIGTEPHDPDLDTRGFGARDDRPRGHRTPCRRGRQPHRHRGGQRFYGYSFICDERGDMLAEFGTDETGAGRDLDLAGQAKHRAAFGSSATAGRSSTGGLLRTSELDGLAQVYAYRPIARRSGRRASRDGSRRNPHCSMNLSGGEVARIDIARV